MTRLKSRQKSAEDSSMSLPVADWKFLSITAFIVAIVAVPTLASLVATEDLTVARTVSRQIHREPASLPDQTITKQEPLLGSSKKELGNLLKNNLISYDLRCSKINSQDFQVDGVFLQLKGKDCGKGSLPPKLNITNKTNGFTASVFFLNEKEYQTDLIQLNDGENQIFIQYQFPSGHKEEHVLKVKAGAI